MTDKKVKKKSLSARVDLAFFDEINQECARLDRSLAWILQKAWQISKKSINNLPTEIKND